jgi:hypothetical protein
MKSRTGSRKKSRAIGRRPVRHSTRMRTGVKRPNDNPIDDVCKAFDAYFKWRKNFAELVPGFFDYAEADQRALSRFEDTQFYKDLQRAYGDGNEPTK